MAVASNDDVAALEARVRALEAERDHLTRQLGDARAAVLLREEIFAAAVHDLRNPLGTVVMGATALLATTEDSDPRSQRVRSVAERIARQAERMTRQLANLSDFADIEAGRLAIERAPHSIATLLAAVRELIEPIATERGVTLELIAEGPTSLACDGDRVVQALVNLTGHAIRGTGRGGAIELGWRGGAMFVRDRVAAADAGRGAGLATSIARGIAEAHGGRLWSERTAEHHTVYFALSPGGAAP